MAERIGDWIQTFTGRQFWPLDPRPEEIDIVDISEALSKQCRFGGHCHRFYSVAEHSVLVAASAPDELKLQALMHDAAEAYLIDLPRPLKHCMPEYRAIETDLERCIFGRFCLPYPIADEVKQLDNAILFAEREQNMTRSRESWAGEVQPLDVTLRFWTPGQANHEFIAAFHRYGGVHG